jgi:2-C-methyl-D-erythritol 2,4-cyclodiphosphate synthase
MRIGHGWDLHRLAPGRPCRIGGLDLPHDKGPLGHSDGDVVLHALADALLGAAALGDIGVFFPDTDPRWKGVDSTHLLAEVLERVRSAGLVLGNVDITIVAQEPKIGPHRQALRENLARLLDADLSRVSLKAKTTEGLGDIGAGEAIACHAVVLLEEGDRVIR